MDIKKGQIDPRFWHKRRVLITGHTGFKGVWLSLWLHAMGAKVTGYSLPPPTKPNLFDLCRMNELIISHIADIRDLSRLSQVLKRTAPELIFHMAAQPLVRESYVKPVETYETNVMGTVNMLEAVRKGIEQGIPIRTVIFVTSDKCYENTGSLRSFKETDRLGGFDPYSNSKACAELVVASYRDSFFKDSSVGIASVRSGNVIGGGDWAKDRLIPDCIRALLNRKPIQIRYPNAVRPWQHVLEPLRGYLLLAQQLAANGQRYSQAWNFGPEEEDTVAVEQVVRQFCHLWGEDASYRLIGRDRYEEHVLRLDCDKAKKELAWSPQWNLNTALQKTVEWVKEVRQYNDVRSVCLRQLSEYEEGGRAN